MQRLRWALPRLMHKLWRGAEMPRKYLITITMPDGSYGYCRGLFASDWDAIDAMMSAFHDARRISARRES